jgi:hypothetical protein
LEKFVKIFDSGELKAPQLIRGKRRIKIVYMVHLRNIPHWNGSKILHLEPIMEKVESPAASLRLMAVWIMPMSTYLSMKNATKLAAGKIKPATVMKPKHGSTVDIPSALRSIFD